MVFVRISRSDRSYSKASESVMGVEHECVAAENAIGAADGAWEAVEIEMAEVVEGNENADGIDGAEAAGGSVMERD